MFELESPAGNNDVYVLDLSNPLQQLKNCTQPLGLLVHQITKRVELVDQQDDLPASGDLGNALRNGSLEAKKVLKIRQLSHVGGNEISFQREK